MTEFWQSYESGKQSIINAIVHALPHIYSSAFALILSGHLNSVVTGLFIVIGTTMLIVGGAWKFILQVIWRRVTIT